MGEGNHRRRAQARAPHPAGSPSRIHWSQPYLSLGLSDTLLLAVLFAALHGLLMSEEAAILMGSLLMFGLVTLTMVLTRRLDWYALEKGVA
ncbi:inner membrane CreD family protein [Thiorhodovibrio winogradskyi]|uniref:inner membrane CreD family protein n=1 Tax=Thiorhodovibrio winogradskyi TaxID=77007 RepID=UPI003D330185